MSYSRSKTRLNGRSPLQAWALEPRMMFDAAALATAEQVIDATATKPGVTATGNQGAVTISDNSTGQDVDLFSGVKVISAQDNQELTELVITVNTSGSNQGLVVDGSTIALQAGSAVTADNNYSYTVTVSGGVTRLTLSIASSEAYSPDDVAKLIDSIAYKALDNTVESGTVTVTLESLSDDGDTADLNISATVDIDSQINVAPVVNDGHEPESAETITLADLGEQAQVSYSADGKYAYVAGEGNLSVFAIDDAGRLSLVNSLAVDGMGSVTELVSAPSGNGVYAIDGTENIYMFSLDESGKLTLSNTINSNNGDITGGLALSEDGNYLYAGTQYNDVAIFKRDAQTGELTYLSRAPGSDGSSDRNGVIATRGDIVYVVYTTGTHSIIAYQRQTDGNLTRIASLNVDGFGYWSVGYNLAVSADGKSLYVANPEENTLNVYRLSEGTLTEVDSMAFEGVQHIALSADGKSLYVTDQNGALYSYLITANGSLSQLYALSDVNGKDLAVSQDGLSLLITTTEGLTRFTLAQTMTQGSTVNFADEMTLSDSNNDALNEGQGNYLGSQIIVSVDTQGGTFGFSDGNNLTYNNGVISLDNQAIATVVTDDSGNLVVTFSEAVSKSVANQVLNQLVYSNDSATAGSFIKISVTVSDGQLTSDAMVTTLRVNSVPQVNNDAAQGYSLDKAISETHYNFTLISGLFSDEDGDSLTWNVSGLPEGIVFDPITRTLSGQALETGTFTLTITVTDASGGSASIERSLEVTQIDNRAPVVNDAQSSQLSHATVGSAYTTTLDPTLFSDPDSLYGDTLTWSVSGLPAGLSFDPNTLTISGTTNQVQDATITVTVTDGSDASVSKEMTLRVISVEEASNNAPDLTASTDALTYTSDGKLEGFNKYVNSITLSNDGTLLIVAANDGNNLNGNSTLFVYSRDTKTGELTQIQSFTQGIENDGDDSNGIEANGLKRITSVTYSSDGSLLFVTGYGDEGSTSAYSISVFSVGADGLTSVGLVADIPETVLDIKVSDQGNRLYALSATTLYSYQIGDKGALTEIGTYQPSNGFGTAVELEIDAKGTVYVGSNARISVYQPASDGSLTFAGQVTRISDNGGTLLWTDATGTSHIMATGIPSNAISTINAIAVSDSGDVYATTSNGYLTVFSFDNDTQSMRYITALDAYSALNQYPHTVVLSSDGSTLYIAGAISDVVALYKIDDNGVPQFSETFSVEGGISRMVVSEDGKSIYGGKHMYFGTIALSILKAGSVAVEYDELSTVSIAQAITLTDKEYDALNNGQGNYKGAVITLERTGGGQDVDTYGLNSGDGLALDNGVLTLDGKAIATFETVDNKLVLTFTDDVDTQTANQILHRLTYANTSDMPGSKINITLTVADKYSASTIDLQLNVNEINNPPSMVADGKDVTYISGGTPVKLFENVVISAGESDQTIGEITLKVENLQDGNQEILVIGDTTVVLNDGTSSNISVEVQITEEDGSVSSAYYSVTANVSVVDGVASVTLKSNGDIPSTAMANMVQSIAYKNNASDYSETPSVGTRTVTITSVKDSGGTANNGVDTTALAISSEVTVSLTNSAPTVSAEGNQGQFIEKGDGTSLFNDVVISTGEVGQTITGIGLSVSGLQDGSNETLTIGGTSVALTDGNAGMTADGIIYEVSVEDGVASVTLSASNGLSTDAAAQTIAGITYANASNDPTEGQRTITLTSIQDDGGTSDDGQDTTAVNIAATVTVVAVNDAPVIAGAAQANDYSVSGTKVPLFSDVSVSAVEQNQSLSSLTFTVSGVQDGAGEYLTLDGVDIALVAGKGTTSAGYDYQVTVADGVVTVTLTAQDGLSGAQSAQLIEQSRYSNSTDVKSAGVRTVSVSVQDNGGGEDTTQLTASAQINIVDNSPPVLEGGVENNHLAAIEQLGDIQGLSDVVTSSLSADGKTLYVASSEGNLAVFERQTSDGKWVYQETITVTDSAIQSITVSEDGSHVLVLSEAGNRLTILTPTAEGTGLEASGTITTQNVSDVAISADGKTVYVVDGNYFGLKVYSQDAQTGEYSQSAEIAGATGSEPYLFSAVEIKTVGNYVYVLTDPASDTVANTLIVYQVQENGQLSDVAYIRDGQGQASIADGASLTVSQDGKQIWVASDSGISLFAFDAGTEALTVVNQQTGFTQITDIALSADGQTLYVTEAAGSISRYIVATDGSLTLKQTLDSTQTAGLHGASQVIAGANGSVVVIGDKGIVSLSDSLADEIVLTYTEGETRPISDFMSLNDAEYDGLNDGAGNYQGASISLGRSEANSADQFGFTAGNGLTLENGNIVLDGKTIATFVNQQGSLTLTFTGEVSRAVANQVLQQITYTHAGADPGTHIALILKVTDSYGASDSVTLSLDVTTINDAPTMTATPVNGNFTEGGTPTSLFTDSQASTIEQGQHLIKASLNVAGVVDGASEKLTLDGTQIALVAGEGETTNGYHYQVSVEGDVVTVTLSASQGLPLATLVNGMTYSHDSQDPTGGTRTVTLTSIQDDGGTEQGGQDSTALNLASTVNVIPVNNPPVVTGNGGQTDYTEGDDAVSLFTDVSVDTVEAGQTIRSINLTVTGIKDGSSEVLHIDGSDIALVNGTGTTESGYTWAVTVADGVATVTVESTDGIKEPAAVIEHVGYSHTSNNPTEGVREIVLSQVRDSGGDADTSQTSLKTEVTVIAVNSAPEATVEQVDIPGATQGTHYSVSFPEDLFSDVEDSDLTWSMGDLPEGLTFDPQTLTLSGTPAVEGTYALTLTATDSQGASASIQVNVVIAPNPVNPVVLVPSSGIFPGTDNNAPSLYSLLSQSAEQQPTATFASDSVFDSALANGPLDLAASPWSVNPIQFGTLPELEHVDFKGLTHKPVNTQFVDVWQPAAGDVQVYSLAEQGRFVDARLANGRPLPEWIQFDQATGQLRMNDAQAPLVGQVQLRLTRVDGSILLLTLREPTPVALAEPVYPQDAVAQKEHSATEPVSQGKPAFSTTLAAEHGDDKALLEAALLLATTAAQA